MKFSEYRKGFFLSVTVILPLMNLLLGLQLNKIGESSIVLPILTLGIFVYLVHYAVALYSKRNYLSELRNLIFVVLIFLPVSLLGPFLLPPSDPIYHSFVLVDSLSSDILKNIPNKAYLNKKIFQIFVYLFESDYWQYNFIHLILLFHVFTTNLLISSTYIASRLYGLNFKWSIVSVLLMILFFGTDRFSYFTYYSLAPSSINMAFFWIFTGILLHLTMKPYRVTCFIMKKIGFILFLGISVVPIIYYNHHQEGGFFFFLYLLVGTILISRMIHESRWTGKLKIFSHSSIVFILSLPTYLILKIFNKLPMDLHLRIEDATEHLTNYNTIWIFGKLGGPRICETLSFYGFAPLLIFILYVLYCMIGNQKINRKVLLATLPGLLAFWLMLIPLNFMIWIKAVKVNEHLWRMAYISQFWFPIAYFLYRLERLFILSNFFRNSKKYDPL